MHSLLHTRVDELPAGERVALVPRVKVREHQRKQRVVREQHKVHVVVVRLERAGNRGRHQDLAHLGKVKRRLDLNTIDNLALGSFVSCKVLGRERKRPLVRLCKKPRALGLELLLCPIAHVDFDPKLAALVVELFLIQKRLWLGHE
eukprot:Amastigsp_a845136_49.p4 type:complete len:146 gc:universal Amastigsp_a845136_49:1631-2068(+)